MSQQQVSKDIAKIMFRIEITVELFRKQNFHRALMNTVTITDSIGTLLESIASDKDVLELTGLSQTIPQVIDMLKELAMVQESGDTVLLADLLELKVMPWLLDVQSCFIAAMDCIFVLDDELFIRNITSWYKKLSTEQKNVKKVTALYSMINNKGYSFREKVSQTETGKKMEFTGSGMPTICVGSKGKEFYMHSNQFPAFEGYQLAKSWYKESFDNYIIFGMGLGYAVSGLFEVNHFVNVTVYEYDWDRLMLAFSLQEFEKWIEAGQLTICYDPEFAHLQEHRRKHQEDETLVIHYPSMMAIKEVKQRESLEDYFIQYSSIQNQRYMLNGNFKLNTALRDQNVSVLRNIFKGKDLYIVAAGPSLDRNFKELRCVKNGIILATGTVLKKLLQADIKPDFVILSDAFDTVYEQIRGVEDCNIPLIYLSTVYAGVPKNYLSDRYIVLQHEFEPAEIKAAKDEQPLFYTGGSVSTTAMELGIAFESRRIIFLGLDLAFTGNQTHASGTPRAAIQTGTQMREVPGINQEVVKTSKNMDSYRLWIERRIERYHKEFNEKINKTVEKKEKMIEFIDATEGGARVSGTRIMKLSEAINTVKNL